jgi:predicted small lipoprotein YifL
MTLFITLTIISSCGVKGPPAIPTDKNMKSYVEQFQTSKETKECKNNQKKKCP